jgi:alpha-glucosidase (family GH31 glycosyl hydrolase)
LCIFLHARFPKIEFSKAVSDCVELSSSAGVNWYGGNEQRWQNYPIQKLVHKHNSYVTKEEFNQAIAERYWLNSHGIYFYVDLDAPLFIDQNNEHPDFMCLQARRALPYDIYHSRFDFTYHIGIGLNARDAHMRAIERFLGKPSGHPDEAMVREPIWSTWARYKVDVNDAVVRTFANEILSNGFNGQFELDDDWEVCYGALTFRDSKFPNIKNLTDWLHSQNFRVTLWIHPFINKNCTDYYSVATENQYLVADHSGNTDTQWWNSQRGEAAYIDFTKPEAATWFYNRLDELRKSAGIDSYKFDAGETSWTPSDPVLSGTRQQHPSKIVQDYVRTVAKFGPLVEVRAAQNTQDLPIFVRMIDKDTEWTLNNGLPSLITTMLQVNCFALINIFVIH